jgi:hypothetical protein
MHGFDILFCSQKVETGIETLGLQRQVIWRWNRFVVVEDYAWHSYIITITPVHNIQPTPNPGTQRRNSAFNGPLIFAGTSILLLRAANADSRRPPRSFCRGRVLALVRRCSSTRHRWGAAAPIRANFHMAFLGYDSGTE